MGYHRRPYELVTYDDEKQRLRAGYSIGGRYVSICSCRCSIIFKPSYGMVICNNCQKKYTVEPVNR